MRRQGRLATGVKIPLELNGRPEWVAVAANISEITTNWFRMQTAQKLAEIAFDIGQRPRRTINGGRPDA